MKKTHIALAFILLTSSNAWAAMTVQNSLVDGVYNVDIGGGGGTIATCSIANCKTCNTAGSCTACNSGYNLMAGSCTKQTILTLPDLTATINRDETVLAGTVATVSSCPTGMTKSSDGCCCVNN